MSHLNTLVEKEVNAWFAWLPKWRPQMHRGKVRVCKRCTGSPIAVAAGFARDTPHPVVHALLTRIHRLIDREVAGYTKDFLPVLQAELDGAELWRPKSYNAKEGLPDEVAGIDPDLIFEEGDHPVLFTFAELEAVSASSEPLPPPPLTREEKEQLRKEIRLADIKASEIGQEICFILLEWRPLVTAGVREFIEPQVQELLDELSNNLDTP